jgi:hypothetical protein
LAKEEKRLRHDHHELIAGLSFSLLGSWGNFVSWVKKKRVDRGVVGTVQSVLVNSFTVLCSSTLLSTVELVAH